MRTSSQAAAADLTKAFTAGSRHREGGVCISESACEGAATGRTVISIASGGDGGEAAAEGRVNGHGCG